MELASSFKDRAVLRGDSAVLAQVLGPPTPDDATDFETAPPARHPFFEQIDFHRQLPDLAFQFRDFALVFGDPTASATSSLNSPASYLRIQRRIRLRDSLWRRASSCNPARPSRNPRDN